MDRLSHDLNLALEESNCGRDHRRRLGLRRRTRSAGNIPAAVSVALAQDDSSSSPPQAFITQPTDSDEPHSDHTPSLKSRHCYAVGNFESDSFNENFSPTRAITRRKRKFKKMPVDCTDGACSPPLEISVTTEISLIPTPSTSTQPYPLTPHVMVYKKNHFRERNTVCGKRKWSHRGDGCEMRERSLSGGCTSKLTFLAKNYDFIKKNADRKRKESVLQPSKIMLKPHEEAGASSSALPGRASFTFVHRSGVGVLGRAPPPPPPPPPPAGPMECGDDSSSLSSSDVESIVTNGSDREGDDELTDWPGIEELKVFNKTLSFRASKPAGAMPPPKRLKKEKLLVKGGWASCKNRFKKKCIKTDSGNESETLLSDSATVVEAEVAPRAPPALRPPAHFASFSDIQLAGGKGENANEIFYQSFRAYEEKVAGQEAIMINKARSNSSLQKTSSGDVAEEAAREIRAGCRRVRGPRPALLIQSAAAEQLSRFLQDARRPELRLPPPASALEEHSLRELAHLYSLELSLDGVFTVINKTSKTTQAVPVEASFGALASDHKRRCYGECEDEDELPLAGPGAAQGELPLAGPGVAQDKLPLGGPRVTQDELPLAEPFAAQEELPLAGPIAAPDELPLAGPGVAQDELPLAGPGIAQDELPLAEPCVAQDELPLDGPRVAECQLAFSLATRAARWVLDPSDID